MVVLAFHLRPCAHTGMSQLRSCMRTAAHQRRAHARTAARVSMLCVVVPRVQSIRNPGRKVSKRQGGVPASHLNKVLRQLNLEAPPLSPVRFSFSAAAPALPSHMPRPGGGILLVRVAQPGQLHHSISPMR